jgi:hypothetical protein
MASDSHPAARLAMHRLAVTLLELALLLLYRLRDSCIRRNALWLVLGSPARRCMVQISRWRADQTLSAPACKFDKDSLLPTQHLSP